MTDVNHNHKLSVLPFYRGILLHYGEIWCWNYSKFRLFHKNQTFQTTSDLKVWIQTFAKNFDKSGRPAFSLANARFWTFFTNLSQIVVWSLDISFNNHGFNEGDGVCMACLHGSVILKNSPPPPILSVHFEYIKYGKYTHIYPWGWVIVKNCFRTCIIIDKYVRSLQHHIRNWTQQFSANNQT